MAEKDHACRRLKSCDGRMRCAMVGCDARWCDGRMRWCDGRMRCAMLCAMVGCDARGNFHRASHPTIAPRIARCDFQRFSSRIASRDALREGKTSRLASRDARRDVFPSRSASRDARRDGRMRCAMEISSRIASYHRTKHRASHPTIAHRILPSHKASRIASYHRASHPTIA